jgi:hypothetical protein
MAKVERKGENKQLHTEKKFSLRGILRRRRVEKWKRRYFFHSAREYISSLSWSMIIPQGHIQPRRERRMAMK